MMMNIHKHKAELLESVCLLRQGRKLANRLCGHSSRMFLTLVFFFAFAQGIWPQSDNLERERVGSPTEGFDTLSYVLGDAVVRSVVESLDTVFTGFEFDKENLGEMIRGIEENLSFMKFSQDTIKNISFRLGALNGVFMSDSFQFKMDKIPFHCILAGLMKDINHELTLPDDTIKIRQYMESLPEDMEPEDLPDEEKCKFFTDYGILKGLQPGLQDFIREETGKSEDEVPADYEAFAAGLAMMVKLMSLEAKQESEQGPYDFGVSIVSTLSMESLSFQMKNADFLEGCRAAAGLTERKISVEESDRIFSTIFPKSEDPTIIQENNTD